MTSTYPSFMPPSNGEAVIAVTNHKNNGDVLFSIPVARELARRHDAKVDFWLSQAWAARDLIAAQKFVRRVIFDPEHPVLKQNFEGPLDLRHGYMAIYELGHKRGFSCSIPEYYCWEQKMPPLPIRFDLPDGYEGRPLPEGKFVAMCPENRDRLMGMKIYREFVAHCPIPVVEIGLPGRTAAIDLGSIDRTSEGFVEMAWAISKCFCYVGLPASPYVIATGFPCRKIMFYYADAGYDQNHFVRSDSHLFVPRQHGETLHEPKEFFQWALPELYGPPPRATPSGEINYSPELWCECPGPGNCPRYHRQMHGRLWEICSGAGCDQETSVRYRQLWIRQAREREGLATTEVRSRL